MRHLSVTARDNRRPSILTFGRRMPYPLLDDVSILVLK
jgi:hypothetical protein